MTPFMMLALAAAADPNVVLRASERAPLALLVSVPTGEAGTLPRSEIVRALAEELETHTSFRIEQAADALMTECEGAVGCIVHRVQSDALRANFLLAISYLTVHGRADRLRMFFVDTREALAEYESADRSQKGWEDEVEVRINDRAVRARKRDVEISDPSQLTRIVKEMIETEIRPVLQDGSGWDPFGTIDLHANPTGATILIDDASVGFSGAGATSIIDVRPGTKRMRVEHEGFEPYESTVEVGAGQSARLDVDLVQITSTGRRLRGGLFWTGVGIAGLGSAVTVVAIARHDGNVRSACWSGAPDCNDGGSFETSGFDKNRGLRSGANPSGVLLAPLGYSLILAGATWALGTTFLGNDDELPWIQLAAGIVAGGLAYGLTAALDHGTPN